MSECKTCTVLLAEGLDLCVRARTLDAIDRRAAALEASGDGDAWVASGRFDEYVKRQNAVNRHQPIEYRSLTPMLWAQEQYDRDLLDWEDRARQHLQSCLLGGAP